jgi:DnaK suppressor protein
MKKKAVKKQTSKKKTAKKKAVKKQTSKKKTAKKKAAKKQTSKKKASRKKTASKKASTKKVSKKKTSSKRPAAARRTTAKKDRTKKISKKPLATKTASATKTKVARNRRAKVNDTLHGVAAYTPRKSEPYMSPAQLEHFREILMAWKAELMQEVDRTVHHMQDEASNFPDPNDRATQESEFGLELRTRDRERKLLKKIASAMGRIDDGSYGFCEETGDEIGLQRLEARPVATLSVEAQERRELAERQYSDRDD